MTTAPYHPQDWSSLHHAHPSTRIPMPEDVTVVYGRDASVLFKSIMSAIRQSCDRAQVLEFKHHTKAYGRSEISVETFWNYLRCQFGNVVSQVMVPCLLQLEDNQEKRIQLLEHVRHWQENFTSTATTPSSSSSSDLTPAVVARGSLFGNDDESMSSCSSSSSSNSEAYGESFNVMHDEHHYYPNDEPHLGLGDASKSPFSPRTSRGGISFMNGIFQMSMSGTSEALDQHNGKFYTDYLIECSWQDQQGTEEKWLVTRRYREFRAMDLILRETYPREMRAILCLPRKRLFRLASMSRECIAQRQDQLGQYLQMLVSNFPQVLETLVDGTVDSFFEMKPHVMTYTRRTLRRKARRQQRADIQTLIQRLTFPNVMAAQELRIITTEQFLILEAEVQEFAHMLTDRSYSCDEALEDSLLCELACRCAASWPGLRELITRGEEDPAVPVKLRRLAQDCDKVLVESITHYRKLLEDCL